MTLQLRAGAAAVSRLLAHCLALSHTHTLPVKSSPPQAKYMAAGFVLHAAELQSSSSKLEKSDAINVSVWKSFFHLTMQYIAQ